MARAKIMVVEDEFLVAKSLKTNLENQGYAVTSLPNSGEEAVRAMDSDRPDLVLMDLLLSGPMDGVQAARQIRRFHKIPVIFITAYANPEVVERAMTAEPFGYLVKPIDTKELCSTIEVALFKAQMEQRLRESDDRLRLVLEATSDGLWDQDLARGTVFRGENWYRMLGYEPGGTADGHQALEELMHPEDLPRYRRAWQSHLEGAERSFHCEYRLRNKEGDWQWVLSRGKVVQWDDQDRPVRIVGTNTDISAAKKAEQALRRSEEKYRLVMENTNEAVMVFKNGRTVFHNSSAPQVLGWPAEKMAGMTIDQFLHPDDRQQVLERYRDRLAGRPVETSYDLRVVDQRGETRWLWLHALLTDWDGEPATLAFLADVTERKKTEADLERARDTLNAALLASPLPIVAVDLTGVVRVWNRAAEKVFGWSAEETVGKFYPLVPEAQRGEFLETMRKMAEGSHPNRFPVERWTKDGSPLELDMRTVGLRDAQGRIVGGVAVFTPKA